MIKYILFLVLSLSFSLLTDAESKETPLRALFVSVIQDPPIFSSPGNIEKLINFSKKANIKVLFVQIYRAGLAWFPSEMGDDAPYKKSLTIFKKDPFSELIRQAHQNGIEVHAWLNLMSLGGNKNVR